MQRTKSMTSSNQIDEDKTDASVSDDEVIITYDDVARKISLNHPRSVCDQLLELAIQREELLFAQAVKAHEEECKNIELHNSTLSEEEFPLELPEEPQIDLSIRREFYQTEFITVDHEIAPETTETLIEYDDDKFIKYITPGVQAVPEEIRNQILNDRFKAERESQVKQISVTVDDLVFDGDEESQTRMSRRISILKAKQKVNWKLADNTVAAVTKEQLVAALKLAVQKQDELWLEQ